MNSNISAWVFSALVVGFGAPALAWGPEGHTVIASVAATRLSPQAAAGFFFKTQLLATDEIPHCP